MKYRPDPFLVEHNAPDTGLAASVSGRDRYVPFWCDLLRRRILPGRNEPVLPLPPTASSPHTQRKKPIQNP